MKKVFRGILFIAVFFGILLSTGCKDFNKTFENNTNHWMNQLKINIKVEGAGTTFPAISEWYNNHHPINIVPLGGGYFQITWHVNVPPGGSVHVGGSFVDDQDVEYINGGLLDAGSYHYRVSGLSMRHRMDYNMGLVVDAYNVSDLEEPLRVYNLQWAVSDEHIPLANLDWSDPLMETLDWEPVTADIPFDLYPGEEITFDVPDDALAGHSFALVRWITGNIDGEIQHLPVYEIPISELSEDATEVPDDAVPGDAVIPTQTQ